MANEQEIGEVVRVRIIAHLEYEGHCLSVYPGYEIGTEHTVTAEGVDDVELNGDIFVLKSEIEVVSA